jgi:hypothetical protein
MQRLVRCAVVIGICYATGRGKRFENGIWNLEFGIWRWKFEMHLKKQEERRTVRLPLKGVLRSLSLENLPGLRKVLYSPMDLITTIVPLGKHCGLLSFDDLARQAKSHDEMECPDRRLYFRGVLGNGQ